MRGCTREPSSCSAPSTLGDTSYSSAVHIFQNLEVTGSHQSVIFLKLPYLSCLMLGQRKEEKKKEEGGELKMMTARSIYQWCRTNTIDYKSDCKKTKSKKVQENEEETPRTETHQEGKFFFWVKESNLDQRLQRISDGMQ